MEPSAARAPGNACLPLFGEQGLRELDEFVVPDLLCAFDFDGTLAPIVARPDEARLPDEVRQRLEALAGLAPVAVVTGRSVADIRERLGFRPDHVIGNHGMEGVPGNDGVERRYRDTVAGWRRALRAGGLGDGVELEDKGLSLSLHYRLAPDPEGAARDLRVRIDALSPRPHVIDGKCVFNLMPTADMNKGLALLALMAATGRRHALYAGDDATDEDVFRLRHPGIFTIRIDEGPDTAARYFVPGHEAIVPVLDTLIAALERIGRADARVPRADRGSG